MLRTFDDSGFVFYTNYNGRKGKELAENPQAALVFYWPPAESPVRRTGEAIGFDRTSSNFGKNGPAGYTTDCVTDVRRDDGS